MRIARRTLLQLAGAFSGLAGIRILGIDGAMANEGWRHGSSLFGELKYAAGFSHFDYVNPNAPKGGRARMYGIGSFDSLNPFTFKGSPAGLVGFSFETLMAGSLDEPSSEYGLIAEAVKHPDDYSSVSFRLRDTALFHDGSAITPDDVIWTMEALKQAHPRYAFYYQNITEAEQTGDREVTFRFSQTGNRELPQITGQLPVLPKAWWTGTSADGEPRDVTATTLETPLGSGPYRVSDVKPGKSITIRRVEDYWGANLPVQLGRNNFDEITMSYYRDQTVAFEAFKGDEYDWRRENSSKQWATGYDFPAVKKKHVVLDEIHLKNSQGMQGFVFNTRRGKFADARVRQAFNFAYDFEWANTNLFHDQYTRTASYFSNSELASSSLPEGAELEILDEVRGQVPDEVFSTPFTNPVNEQSADQRKNLRKALELFRAAGWAPGSDRVLTNDKGEKLEVEFMLVSPLFERIVLPYTQQLKRIGVQSTIRLVDSAQYERRVQGFDFDVIVSGWGQSLSPGNEQREYWGSAAADRQGSQNYAGIKDPAIDKLIDRIIFARDREELVAATRALDRVLLWHHFVVPMWHIPYERIARWDRFGRPDQLPDYDEGFPAIWWWDEDKAKKVKSG